MNIEELRDYCLALPNTTDGMPFGDGALVFKVVQKMFLIASLDAQPLRFSVKCDPERALSLREQYPQSVLPGYHLNKKHWNTVVIDGEISRTELFSFIDHSYQLVAPRPSKRQ